MKKLIKIALVFILIGGSFFLGRLKEPIIEYKETIVNLTAKQKAEILYDMISLDSALTLAEELCEERDAQINWVDSINWIKRDTLITKYELMPKYYSIYGLQKEISHVPVQEPMGVPVELKDASRFGFGISTGYAVTYSFNDILVGSDYQPHQGWGSGFYFGAGITYILVWF